MFKFKFFIFLISTNSFIDKIRTAERRVVYEQTENVSQESSEESIKNNLSDKYNLQSSMPKPHLNSVITFRESEQDYSNLRENNRNLKNINSINSASNRLENLNINSKNRDTVKDQYSNSISDSEEASSSMIHSKLVHRNQNSERKLNGMSLNRKGENEEESLNRRIPDSHKKQTESLNIDSTSNTEKAYHGVADFVMPNAFSNETAVRRNPTENLQTFDKMSLQSTNRRQANRDSSEEDESDFSKSNNRISRTQNKKQTERVNIDSGENIEKAYHGVADFLMPNDLNNEKAVRRNETEKLQTFHKISSQNTNRRQTNRDSSEEEEDSEFSDSNNLKSLENNKRNYHLTSSQQSVPKIPTKSTLIRNSNNQSTTNLLSSLGSSTSTSKGRTKTEKKQRLCEKKYMEYMTRIFNDDDTVADGSDSDYDGRVLVERGEYPHMTALGFIAPGQPIDYKCGGSLISENFVITAAHCANFTGEAPKKARIGDLNLMVEERNLEPQIRNISRIFKHPEYRSHLYYNDIALLELDEPVEFTEFVRPIRLWIDMPLPANTTAHAMGYGSTAFGKARTNRLTDMNLTIVPNDDCRKDMPDMPETPLGIISTQICARDYLMNRDTCQGDSGGPLQLNLRGRRRRNRKHYHLIGITSYGMFCRSNYPSVYTRVSEFLDWIEQIVWLTQH